MYYPLYNNPFFYPYGAYIPNVCSNGYNLNSQYLTNQINSQYTTYSNETLDEQPDKNINEFQTQNTNMSDLFSIKEDRIEAFGISINIDDLIILIMLFFLLRESQVDFSIIIVLALILFDQS